MYTPAFGGKNSHLLKEESLHVHPSTLSLVKNVTQFTFGALHSQKVKCKSNINPLQYTKAVDLIFSVNMKL